MVNIYTKEDYSKSYTELLEILKYVDKEDLGKIPKSKIQFYIKNQDTKYIYKYNKNLSFEYQPVSHLTKILIANLYTDYWADDEEKQKINLSDKQELDKLELIKREKYNPDNLFKNKTKYNSTNETSLTVIEERSFIKRFLNKIKKFLNLT